MADYKKAQEEFRQAQRELWMADENEGIRNEDVWEAENRELTAEQALEDMKKRLETWNDIYEKGTFDARQREIQRIQDLAPDLGEMKGLQMTMPETLDALNEQQLGVLGGLAENSEKARKEGISLNAYEAAKDDLDRLRERFMQENPELKALENTIKQLDSTAENQVPDIEYLSKKLPYVNERKALYEKYGSQADKMVDILNTEIQADDTLKNQVGSVESVWEEAATIEAMKQELANQKGRNPLPKKAEEIAALRESDPRRTIIRTELENYQERKKQVESAKAAVEQAELEKQEIPTTFTALKKLAQKNPRMYEVKENQINQMIQSKMTDDQRRSEDFPKSLSEYLEKEKALEVLTSEVQRAEKERRGNVYNEKSKQLKEKEKIFATNKAQIKAWIPAENKQNSPKLNQIYETKKQEFKTAEENLKKSEKQLEAAGKKYNEEPVKNMETQIAQLKKEHEAHEKLLADRVSQWNRQKKETLSKVQGFQESQEKVRNDLRKAVNQKMTEAIKGLGEDSVKALEMDQQEVERQKRGLEELLKEENRRILARNAEITKNNREIFRQAMNQNNSEVKKYWDGQESQLKSDCRKADFMKSVVGVAASAIGCVTTGFRDLMMTMTDAVIKGEVEEEREKAAAIQKELDDVKRRQEERIGHMGGISRNEGQDRVQTGLDALSQDLKQAEELNTKKESLQKDLIAQNQIVSEMDAGLEEKIRNNHAEIDKAFGSVMPYDEKQAEEYLEQMEAIYKEAAGNNGLQQKLAEAGVLAERQNMEAMTAENRKMMEDLQSSMTFIQSGSDKAASSLKPSSIEKMNTFIDISMKLVNFALKKNTEAKNAAKGVAAPEISSEINLSEQLNSLKEKLQNPEASTTPQVVQQLMELGSQLYGTLKDINQGIQNYSKEAYSKAVDKRIELENTQKLHKGFEDFQEEIKDDPEMGNKSYAEQLKMFLDKNSESAKKIVDEQTSLLQQAVEKAEINVQKAKDQTASKRTNQEEYLEQAAEAGNKYRQKKQALKQAFLETVRENAEKPNGPVTITSEELALSGGNGRENGFAFLSKLTGTELNENTDLGTAMDAFSRVYINGLNASAYFQMGSRYQEAVKGDLDAQKRFLQEMADHGEDLRSAMENTMYPAAGRILSDGAKQLSGQMIAVENSNMMLQPVLMEMPLSNAKQTSGLSEKQVANYNRFAQMTADNFNEMRKSVAGVENTRQASASGPDAGRKKIGLNDLNQTDRTRDQRLAKAVHASRKESLEKRRQEEKVYEPKTRVNKR